MITFRTSALYSRNRVHRRCENINYRCTVLEKQAHRMFLRYDEAHEYMYMFRKTNPPMLRSTPP